MSLGSYRREIRSVFVLLLECKRPESPERYFSDSSVQAVPNFTLNRNNRSNSSLPRRSKLSFSNNKGGPSIALPPYFQLTATFQMCLFPKNTSGWHRAEPPTSSLPCPSKFSFPTIKAPGICRALDLHNTAEQRLLWPKSRDPFTAFSML